jgi:hypothetical protein
MSGENVCEDTTRLVNTVQNTSAIDLGKIIWKRLSWSFILYLFVTITLGLTVLNSLASSGRWLSAVIFLILGILIFYFYGIRWFTGTQSKFEYTGPWPPVINMCPDYLVYKKIGTHEVCVDMIGVSRGGNNGLQPYNGTTNVMNGSSLNTQFFFKPVIKPTSSVQDRRTACRNAIKAGLTWEGITNGDSCTF